MVRLSAVKRLVREDDGQDLIEYALLSAFIGLAGVTVFNAMGATMATAYTNWNTAVQSDPLVEMPDPK
jgi:Flp pilus assembly pilin Flp